MIRSHAFRWHLGGKKEVLLLQLLGSLQPLVRLHHVQIRLVPQAAHYNCSCIHATSCPLLWLKRWMQSWTLSHAVQLMLSALHAHTCVGSTEYPRSDPPEADLEAVGLRQGMLLHGNESLGHGGRKQQRLALLRESPHDDCQLAWTQAHRHSVPRALSLAQHTASQWIQHSQQIDLGEAWQPRQTQECSWLRPLAVAGGDAKPRTLEGGFQEAVSLVQDQHACAGENLGHLLAASNDVLHTAAA